MQSYASNNTIYWNQPTEDERVLYDAFVAEYMRDFNPVDACIRMGFQLSYALEYSKRFMTVAYVLNQIQARKEHEPDAMLEQEQRDKALILNTLREAAAKADDKTRVAAVGKLMQIYGMDKRLGELGEADDLIDAFREFARKVPV